MLSRRAWMDWGVPALLAALCVMEVLAVRPAGMAAAFVLELVACAALVFRRHHPAVVGLVAGVFPMAIPWFGAELDELAAPLFLVVLAVFSVARWLADHRGLLAVAAIVAGLAMDYAFTDERSHDITDLFFVATFLVPPYVFGRIARKLAVQTELLARQQELVRREAARAERDRIARELHDVIAHSVSAMVVQTAAAQDLLASDPDRAARILEDVATTGRQALSETGQLLHVLRDTDNELGLAPTPGLADVSALVERFRSEGLDVRASYPEPIPDLPTAVDVSSYRVVQEALTNALRYAPDRRVDLVIEHAGNGLSIRTSNLAAPARASEGSGLGLLGLAERVSLLGGRLRHGLSGGRFELAAELPIGPLP